MSFTILSIGTALPSTKVDQAEGLRLLRALCCRTREQAAWLPGVYANSGVRTRHLALGADLVRDVLEGTRHSGSVYLPGGAPDDRGPTTAQRMQHFAELAPPLALRAAGEAVERSGLAARDFTHLVTVSCTGFLAPGLDWWLIRRLGLAPTVERTHVGFMGCHGALNGLRAARAFTEADAEARVLLCAAELCSLHLHYGGDPQTLISNTLFADGAAAVVGAGFARPAAWRVAATGSCLVPDSAAAMSWNIGDHGFEMTLSKRVPALIARHLRPWLEGWLGQQGIAHADVASWAVHPGGPRILDAVEDALGLPPAATADSRAVLAECGNMSSPTVLFVLERLRAREAALPCVALAFGPGLVAEAALFLR
jgi:predicted naringenin-chalcone synthase